MGRPKKYCDMEPQPDQLDPIVLAHDTLQSLTYFSKHFPQSMLGLFVLHSTMSTILLPTHQRNVYEYTTVNLLFSNTTHHTPPYHVP